METDQQSTGSTVTHLLLAEDIPMHSGEVADLLNARGFRTTPVASESEVQGILRDDPPGLVVVIDTQDSPRRPGPASTAREAALRLGIPVLAVVDDLNDPEALAERTAEVDDWVSLAGAATELPARVARLLRRRNPRADEGAPERASEFPSFGPKFLSLVVHDLRTPLNVIGLTLRIISQSIPRNDPDVAEDLRYLEENYRVMVRMLAQLSDYHRLYESASPADPVPFSPARLVDDLVAEMEEKPIPRSGKVELRVDPSCPDEVALDPLRAKLAIQYALLNAQNSAKGAPVRVTLRGGNGRWVTDLSVDQPPPSCVHPARIDPLHFERICGSEGERRGMDLSIGARVSEQFGGSCRLEVVEGRGTTVVFDWPVTIGGD